MKKIINILYISLIFLSSLCYGKDQNQIKILLEIEESVRKKNAGGNFGFLLSNENGDLAYFVENVEIYEGVFGSLLQYTNFELNGEKLNLTQIITDTLIKLEFDPINFKGAKNLKSEDMYLANYKIFPIGIDEDGFILVRFEHKLMGYNLKKLGVWDKLGGFVYLPIPDIESVSNAYLKNQHLIVSGYNLRSTKEKLIVFSLPIHSINEQAQKKGKRFWGLLSISP